MDAVLPLALPAVRVATQRAELESLEPGESRIGGLPDVPDGFAWPRRNGEALAFIAQLRLEDVPRAGDLGLPAAGSLLFFYAVEQQVWGFDPEDRSGFRVVYAPAGAELRRLDGDPGVPDGGRFPCCAVRFHETLSLPPAESRRAEALGLDEDQLEDYFEALYDVREGDAHQLGGYPEQVQNDMTVELPLVTNGLYTGDASGWKDPRAPALLEEWDRWRLLFQVASDDEAGMMWGDMGFLYFWMREDHLEARDFDRAWLILQCS